MHRTIDAHFSFHSNLFQIYFRDNGLRKRRAQDYASSIINNKPGILFLSIYGIKAFPTKSSSREAPT